MQEIRLLIEESENNVLQQLTKTQKSNNKRRREDDTSFPVFDVSENVDDVSMETVLSKKKQPEQQPTKKQRGDTVSNIPKPHLKFRIAEVASAVREATEATKKKPSVYDDSDDDEDKDGGDKSKKPEPRRKDVPSTSSAAFGNI